MKAARAVGVLGAAVVTAITASSAWAAKPRAVVAEVPLTAAGQELEAGYANQPKALQTEIAAALPAVDG